VRGRAGRQAPAAERARRHRDHARQRGRDRRLRGDRRRRLRPGDDEPAMSGVRERDAATYQRISVPHEEWAEAVLERLPLRGEETVLDAGCGTGRGTRVLVERLPAGRVVAVDGSAQMVEKVREVLRPQDRAMVADLAAFELTEPVDEIVS